MSFIGKVVKGNTDIDDEVIFANSLAVAKASAKAYLTASFVCTTSELRSMFSTHLSQCMLGYSALIELGIKKGWIDPNATPKQTLIKLNDKTDCLFNLEE